MAEDKTHLTRMIDFIEIYWSGKISLSRLLANLRALLDSLSASTPDEWKEKFHDKWWTVEQFFAVGKDRGLSEEKIKKQSDVVRNIKGMYDMLKSTGSRGAE